MIAWRNVPLDKCIETIRAGVSLTGENRPPQNGEVGILTLGAVSGGRFDAEACKAVPASAAAALREPVRGGTLLMSRSNTLDLVGSMVLVDKDHPNRFLPDLLWEITLREDSPLTARFLVDFLSTPAGRALLQSAAMGTSGSMKKLSMARVRRLEVPAVPLPVQEAWARIRVRLTQTEEGCDALLAAKRELKRGLMQELLTGRRRFPEFSSVEESVSTPAGRLPADWGVAKLGKHASELSERNGSRLGPEKAMGVIKGVGLEPMRDHIRSDDLSRYKVVPPHAFAYNPMRINIGSIARSRFAEDCLVSPDYVVFETDHYALLPEFLDHLRHSFLWRRFVTAAGAGSVRVRIYFRDLAELWIPVPPVAEQRRVASTLDALDREIELLEAQRDQFELQKRGVMQKLLSGEIEIPADESEA